MEYLDNCIGLLRYTFMTIIGNTGEDASCPPGESSEQSNGISASDLGDEETAIDVKSEEEVQQMNEV